MVRKKIKSGVIGFSYWKSGTVVDVLVVYFVGVKVDEVLRNINSK